MHKQEASVLRWGSLIVEEEVRNLDAVQNVAFIKDLLWRIDPDYFILWQGGQGSQNLTQVLTCIQEYFRQVIGTDIKDHTDHLNIYKRPFEVWELLLGIAIKGNNRGTNINLILDMDH